MRLIVLLCLLQITLFAEPHLILHFDVNQTLIIGDVVQGKSPNEAIIDALSDQYVDKWDESLQEPMDYNSYIKEVLWPNPNKDKFVKAKQKEMLCGFLDYLKEREHPYYPEVKARFDEAVAISAGQRSFIFNSFYKLCDHLDERGVEYTLVFRTFGDDLPKIAEEITRVIGEQILPQQYNFQGQEEFYLTVKESEQHLAFRDNWRVWYEHDENYAYGKAFPFDQSDENYLSLFFDDNAKLNRRFPEKNIAAPFDVSRGESVSPEKAIEYGCLFPVDTLAALTNEDYYISLVEQALSKLLLVQAQGIAQHQ